MDLAVKDPPSFPSLVAGPTPWNGRLLNPDDKIESWVVNSAFPWRRQSNSSVIKLLAATLLMSTLPRIAGLENSDLNAAAFGFGVTVKEEISVEDCFEADKGVEPIKNLRSLSASSKYVASKCQLGEKSTAAAGTKRNASDWRDTRSNQPLGGPDPHDDFLNTPFENVKRNLNAAANEEHQDSPAHNMKEIDRSFSDDETQDMNVDPCPKKQQVVAPSAGKQSFKFVEPVRRKAERENLKGIECRQCKKFYDAVLPDDESKDNDNNKRNFRCEHHDGVSRHRYKYVPPMTPEGFWNIGFESEM